MTYFHQQAIICGDMSQRPMNDISILLDEVYYPILNNPANHEGWPDVIKKDVDLHIQDLRNTIAEVRKPSLQKLLREVTYGEFAQHAKLPLSGKRLKVLDQ